MVPLVVSTVQPHIPLQHGAHQQLFQVANISSSCMYPCLLSAVPPPLALPATLNKYLVFGRSTPVSRLVHMHPCRPSNSSLHLTPRLLHVRPCRHPNSSLHLTPAWLRTQFLATGPPLQFADTEARHCGERSQLSLATPLSAIRLHTCGGSYF